VSGYHFHQSGTTRDLPYLLLCCRREPATLSESGVDRRLGVLLTLGQPYLFGLIVSSLQECEIPDRFSALL